MTKIIVALITLLGIITLYAIVQDIKLIIIIGHTLLLPLIGIWYGLSRKWQFSEIDGLVYFSYLIGSLSDLGIIIDWSEIGELVQILGALLMQIIFIIIFRKEGTYIYSNKFSDFHKIFIPITLVFIFFGFFLLTTTPDSLYFILIFYAVQEAILMAHGFFRSTSKRSYWWIVIGVSLIFIKDVLYSFHFFVYESQHILLYALMYFANIISYFCIAIGISLAQNDTGLTHEKLSRKAIIKSINEIFKKKVKKERKLRIYNDQAVAF